MKPQVAVAISGGIDSLMAAHLLKKKYPHIVGLHFINGYESSAFSISETALAFHGNKNPDVPIYDMPTEHPLFSIQKQLDIPIKIVDCRQHFKKTVVDYFVQSYRKGLTPNPCMICNPTIKFGLLFKVARQLGASLFATGHYARIIKNPDQKWRIRTAADSLKDQSYFLAFLPEKILPSILFPIGSMTKQAVLDIARQNGIAAISPKESQDVCFIQSNDYARFISSYDGFSDKPGLITNASGKTIGTHHGLYKYTIGQRRGINCPASAPYYVLKIDVKNNRLLVGFKKDLYKNELVMKNINWFIPPPEAPRTVLVKIRYRHPAAEARLTLHNDHSAIIRFKAPQAAITPGQGAACYDNNQLIAGGWIEQ